MGNCKLLIGKTFGTLKVMNITKEPIHLKPRRDTYYLCECNCNLPHCRKTSIVRKDHLLSGNTKSCKANKKAISDLDQLKRSSYNNIFTRGSYNEDDITLDQFISLVSSNCFYCGTPPYKKINDYIRNGGTNFSKENGYVYWNGLDRINSKLKHSISNVVPCCQICNCFKLDRNYMDVINHIYLLKADFIPIFVVSSQTKEQNPLYKLYPESYGKCKGSYINFRSLSFLNKNKRNKRECDFSTLEVAKLMMSNCIYCNSPPDILNGRFNGIDRYVNNNEYGKTGYLKNNCVSACFYCNSAKSQLEIEDFRLWIIRIKSNVSKLPNTEMKLRKLISKRNSKYEI